MSARVLGPIDKEGTRLVVETRGNGLMIFSVLENGTVAPDSAVFVPSEWVPKFRRAILEMQATG